MLERPQAQAIVDAFSAAALGASVFVVARPGSASPLRPRLAFAFGGLCLFFSARSAAAAWPSGTLSLLTLIVSCGLPVAALLLAEGLVRRHAPVLLKTFVTLAAVLAAGAMLATGGRPPFSSWFLGGYVFGSLILVTTFLLTRERGSLSLQENATVDALIASGALLTLLSLSDFLPQFPVGLSGVGAALVAYTLGANPTSKQATLLALQTLVIILAMALATSAALALALGILDARTRIRLAAVLIGAFIAACTLQDARRRTKRGASGLHQALAMADTSTLDAFLDSVVSQPLLDGLRIVEGPVLADYGHAALAAAMAARPVWTSAALMDPHTPIPANARDELTDLMIRTEATHALLVTRSPLRIAVLTLPGVGPVDETLDNLALFGKLAALSAREPA